MEGFIYFILFVWVFFGFLFGIALAVDGKYGANPIKNIKDITKRMFRNKNKFGIFLSCLLFIIMIPSLVTALLYELIIIICSFALYIWELGNKKEK